MSDDAPGTGERVGVAVHTAAAKLFGDTQPRGRVAVSLCLRSGSAPAAGVGSQPQEPPSDDVGAQTAGGSDNEPLAPDSESSGDDVEFDAEAAARAAKFVRAQTLERVRPARLYPPTVLSWASAWHQGRVALRYVANGWLHRASPLPRRGAGAGRCCAARLCSVPAAAVLRRHVGADGLLRP